jgi:hypothetical protein
MNMTVLEDGNDVHFDRLPLPWTDLLSTRSSKFCGISCQKAVIMTVSMAENINV